jgi:hypothetical protein
MILRIDGSFQVQDLVDRITSASATESLLGPYTTREMLLSGNEISYLKRIRLFKWRDVFQSMAIAILRSDAGGRAWDRSGE